jgi:hypothetical protein
VLCCVYWQVPPLQGKLQYMRVLNDLPPFGGLLFHTVGLVMATFIYLFNLYLTMQVSYEQIVIYNDGLPFPYEHSNVVFSHHIWVPLFYDEFLFCQRTAHVYVWLIDLLTDWSTGWEAVGHYAAGGSAARHRSCDRPKEQPDHGSDRVQSRC